MSSLQHVAFDYVRLHGDEPVDDDQGEQDDDYTNDGVCELVSNNDFIDILFYSEAMKPLYLRPNP
jgi:hypothetical protein